MCAELVEKSHNLDNAATIVELRALSFRLVETTVKSLPTFLTPHMPIILRLITTPMMSNQIAEGALDENQSSLVRCLTKAISLPSLRPVICAHLETSSSVSFLPFVNRLALRF
jgi:hypothetical protein